MRWSWAPSSGFGPWPATLSLKPKGHPTVASSCVLMCTLFYTGKIICSVFSSVTTGRLVFNPEQVSLPTHLVPPPLPLSGRKPLAASPAEERETLPCPKPWALLQPRHPAIPQGWMLFAWQTLLVPPDHAFKITLLLVPAAFAGTQPVPSPPLAMSYTTASAESLWFTPWSARGSSCLPTPPEISYQPWKLTAARGSSRLMSQPQLQHVAGRAWPSFNPAK